MMMKSVRLRELDEMESLHIQAWLNQQAQGTRKNGKKIVPVYKDFKSFFDREKLEKEILGIKDDMQMDEFKKLVVKANSQRGGG